MKLLLPDEACALTNLSITELCRRFRHYKIGRSIRFEPLDIEAFRLGPILGHALRLPALAARRGRIYFVEAVGAERLKIGFTSKDSVDERLHRLRTASPFPLRPLIACAGSMAIEAALHHHFRALRIPETREWFRFEKPLRELIAELHAKGTWS